MPKKPPPTSTHSVYQSLLGSSTPAGNQPGISGLQLGAGTFFVTLDTLHSHFAPFGWDRPTFLHLLHCLGCAPLVSPTGIRLIHYFKFIMALESASLLGNPEFWSHAYAQAHSKDPGTPPHQTRLSASYLSHSWQRILGELLFARKHSDLSNPAPVRATLTAALASLSASLARATATIHLAPYSAPGPTGKARPITTTLAPSILPFTPLDEQHAPAYSSLTSGPAHRAQVLNPSPLSPPPKEQPCPPSPTTP